MTHWKKTIEKTALAAGMLLLALHISCSSDPKVTLTEDVETYTLDNGIVAARISKVSGDLVSFRYQGREMFATTLSPDFHPEAHEAEPADNPNWREPEIGSGGKGHGYWSHDAVGPRGSAPAIPSVTIDPKKNGGKRAEVSIRAISNGRKMGTGPGSNAQGNFMADLEIRYTLDQGEAGVYTYSIFDHKPEHELATMTEARYCAKLADFFDWISVAPNRDLYYPKDYNAGDKYVYTVNQTDNPAFGWSSTTEKVGLFFINPSMEYMSGGPTKVEFLGHRNTSEAAEPCVLNYWRSSHYGGAEANVAAGEQWTKVIGPFLIYANTGGNPEEIYADARAKAAVEQGKWPYAWVEGVDYPHADARATVTGSLRVEDPAAPASFANLRVGLAHPPYVSVRPEGAPQTTVDWQRDAKYYQFWTRGNAAGTFEIKNVRPGRYTLYAFTDGVLGEYAKTDVTVEAGKPLDLGVLVWTPVRRGEQLWEVGTPNRYASEFFMADQYYDPEISLKYAELFPNDVTFTVGASNATTDWYFQHVPHNTDPEAKALPFYGVRSEGKATPYTVVFEQPRAGSGKATLRVALCGGGARTIEVAVNGRAVGQIDGLIGDGTITRHGSHGIWNEKDFTFDGRLLRAGQNTLTLTVPAGPVNNGVMYDYIRLELDGNSTL
jgi:rhamnogalacturonan endolyase